MRMPRSSHSPASPPPLPIETTDRAAMPEASTAQGRADRGLDRRRPGQVDGPRPRRPTISGVSTANRSA